MKLFLRFLRNNPLYAAINVVGLALSLMFVILLGDYTWRQMSIDRWHKSRDRIVALATGGSLLSWPDVTHSLGAQYPEIEQTCCINMHLARIKAGDRAAGSSMGEGAANLMLADSTFFDFFDFQIVEGDRAAALSSPEKCVITESMARTLFPGRDPLGESLEIVGTRNITITDGLGDPYDTTLVYTVSAVVRDLDRTVLQNSTGIIVNFQRAPQIMGYRLTNNTYVSGPFGGTVSFLKLRPGADLGGKTDAITAFCKESCPAMSFVGRDINCSLIPLDDLMFAPQNDGRALIKGDRGFLNVLLAAVLAILLFAVTNYINLTVANTGFRAKEVSTRRLLGSDRRHIMLELVGESTLMVLISFLLALLLAFPLQETFQEMFKGKIDLAADLNPGTAAVCLLFILATGLISGIIPTLSLLRYKPIDVVKGSFRYHSKMVLSRIFIVLQNVITVTMLCAALTILLQVNHMISAPLGYNVKDNFIVDADKGDVVRDALARQPFVRGIGSYSGCALDGSTAMMSTHKDKDGNNVVMFELYCDRAFLDVSGLKLKEDFHQEGDVRYFNASAAQKLGITAEHPLVEWGGGEGTTLAAGIFEDFRVINVLESTRDFMIDVVDTDEIKFPSLLVHTDGSADAGSRIRSIVQEADGNLDDPEWKVRDISLEISQSFSNERNTLRVVSVFTGVALLLSVLGFVGMSLFFIRQRRKEVGVRRIMGGTSREIFSLLTAKFLSPLLFSLLLALPLSWILMQRWLENFSYRISFNLWIFAAAALFSLLVALLSIFFQIFKASRANPADDIRTE